MGLIRIRKILTRTGGILLLGCALLLLEQIPFRGALQGAGPPSKSGANSGRDNAGPPKKIIKIDSDITDSSGETVNIVLTGSFPPNAQVIEGNTPRIYCDFPDVKMDKNVQRTVNVDGKYILQVRTGIHPPPEAKTRVVLDLAPNHDYEVEQFFFEKDNRYSIVIRERL